LLLVPQVLVLAAGCGSDSSIRIIESPTAPRPLDRIYAVVHQGQLDSFHALHLRNALIRTFQPRTTAFRVAVITGLELDDSILKADIERFRPDGILMMTPIGGLLYSLGGSYNVSYSAKVLEPKQGRVIWWAKVRNEGAPVMVYQRMLLTARDLARHLTWDHLLRERKGDDLMQVEVEEPE
jgi:hypothetical protein